VLRTRVIRLCGRSVPLKAPLDHAELVALLGRIQEVWELDVAGGRPEACDAGAPWAALLLPPGDPLPPRPGGAAGGGPSPAAASLPHSPGAPPPQQPPPDDAPLLAALVSETRDTLRGGRFAAVLRHALDAAAGVLSTSLRGAFGPDVVAGAGAAASPASPSVPLRLPLAKLVPAVAAASEEALLPPPPPPRSAAARRGVLESGGDLGGSSGDDIVGRVGSADSASSASSGGGALGASETELSALAAATVPAAGAAASPAAARRRPAGGVARALGALRPVDSFCADLFSAV
jgi:hypothetical protein